MKIKYKYSLDDLIAFSNYHNSESSLMTKGNEHAIRMKKFNYFLIAVLIFVIISLVAYIVNSLFLFCVAISIIILALVALKQYRPDLVALNEQNLRGYYTEKPCYKYDQTFELELTDSGLKIKSELSDSLFSLKGFSEIYYTSEHVFIYQLSSEALIIPKKSIIEGELDSFMNEFQEKLKKSKKENTEDGLQPPRI